MPRDRNISRLSVLVSVSIALASLLTVRLWFLQAIDSRGLQERVSEVRTRTVRLTPERGRIFDVKGRIVADNARILTITIDRSVIARSIDRKQMWDRLSGALGMSVSSLEDRWLSKRYDQLQPLPLKEDVSEQLATFLRERSEDYPGVDVREDWRREYPYAPIASHVIGFLGAIPDSTTAAVYYKTLGYDPDARIGRFGVEQTYENDLRGKPGFVKYEVDSRGRIIRQLSRQEAVPGNDIQIGRAHV